MGKLVYTDSGKKETEDSDVILDFKYFFQTCQNKNVSTSFRHIFSHVGTYPNYQ